MKPPCLITFHDAANEGAVLQCVALSHLFERRLGARPFVLDYRSPVRARSYARHPCRAALTRFVERTLRLSPRFTDPAAAADWVNRNASFAVCGSDEVWKWNQPGYCDPFPNIFYGHRIEIPKVAYAVSVGPAPVDRPPPGVGDALRAFALVSARDERTFDFVRAHVPDAERMSDPALGADIGELFPHAAGAVRDKLSRLGVGAHAFLADPALFPAAAVAPFAGGLPVVTSEPSPFTAVGPLEPPEWAALHGTARRVISQRFHSTLFAMRNMTDCVVLTERHKIRDLLRQVGVELGAGAFQWPDHTPDFVARQADRHAAFVDRLVRRFG